MKKGYLFLFFSSVIGMSISAQFADISFLTDTLEIEVVSGNSVDAELVIQNIGNRDLEWMLLGGKEDSPEVYFSKANYADWSNPENQDMFAPRVLITRQDNRGIYNIYSEDSHIRYYSPEGTEWAWGRTENALPGDYDDWLSLTGGNPPSMVGDTVSVHLPFEDLYFDLVTESWTESSNGGGFSWTRWAIYDYLNIVVDSGSVVPLATDTTLIGIDATGLVEGVYMAWVAIGSNDFYEPEVLYPIKITVTGVPDINPDYTSLGLDTTFVGDSSFYELVLYNDGTGPLTVSATDQSGEVQFLESNLEIPAFGSTNLYYAFIPTSAANLVDTIELATNDVVNPLVKIALTGVSQDPPQGSVTGMTTLTETLSVNDSALHYVVLSNTGSANLVYRVSVIGDTVDFEKPDYANYWETMYQDVIRHDIRITRADQQPIFNIARENSFQGTGSPSPEGTLWSAGHPLDPQFPWQNYTDLIYDVTQSGSPWDGWGRYMPIPTTDWFKERYKTLAMYLPDYDEYYSFDMHTWTESSNGGGFSWTRIAYNPGWVDFLSDKGSVASGASDTIYFYLNATEMSSGDYTGSLVIETNEITDNTYTYPLLLTVNSYPILVVEDTLIDFGEVVVNQSDSAMVMVDNVGWDSVYASSVEFISPAFSTEVTEGTLYPGDRGELWITFAPTTEGDYTDTLYIYSNDPANPIYKVPIKATAIAAPEISLSANMLYNYAAPDATVNDTLIVGNTGLGNLYWSITSLPSLGVLLDNLNSNYTQITDLVPNMWDFTWDIQTNSISDGGNDMYDGGNHLSTSLNGSNLIYSDNTIIDGSSHFGAGSQYFTRHVPGLFVLVADLNNISSFMINGNLGADGSGSADGTVLELTHSGITYQGFVKRVYNAGDPSVNHLVIVEKSPTANHSFESNTNNDYHEVFGLTGTSRIYYLLYASDNGGYIDDGQTADIMRAFLDIFVGLPDWMTADTLQGITAPGSTDTVIFTLDAAGLAEGDHLSAPVFVNNNQPDTGAVQVDVHLHVPGTPVTALGDTVLPFGTRFISGTDTLMVTITNSGTDTLYLESTINDSSQFWTADMPVAIARSTSIDLPVYFSPTADVTYLDTMLVGTNDPAKPGFSIILSGTGAYGPEIDVVPMALSDTLSSGTSGDHMVLIHNTGVEVLTWGVSNKGETVNFSKDDYVDWNLPQNQDYFSPSLSITRANQEGLFNAAQEDNYNGDSPSNTEWAQVPSDVASTYDTWQWAVGYNPPSSVGNTYSMHVLDSNWYYDVTFNSWTSGSSGGGFSYSRQMVYPWISANSMGDTVQPGYTDTIMVTLDAAGLNAGTYNGKFWVISDDPNEMLTDIDVTLRVEGEPDIYAYGWVYFNDTYVSDTSYENVYIQNQGSDTLFIDDITNNLAVYGIEEKTFFLLPGESRNILSWFIPDGIGVFTDTFKIHSDDPDEAIVNVILDGSGFTPPTLNLITQAITDNLDEGDSVLVPLILENTGGYGLDWMVYAESTDTVFFEKPDWADWTMVEFQDSISPTLIITRADQQGLFNIAAEGSYCCNGPTNTEWAFGKTIDAQPWYYNDWRNTVYPPPSQVGNTYSLHVLDSDKYYDITFYSWSEDASGGGFSYSRVEVYPEWIAFDSDNGTTDALVTDSITVELDASGMMSGTYHANIVLRTNDTDAPETLIPVELTVTATAEIEASQMAFDFGTVYVNDMASDILYVKNVGVDPLDVAEITIPEGFEVYPDMFVLQSGDSIMLEVTFMPQFDGSYNGNLSITSNDPTDSPLLVSLTGEAILPPDIIVAPEVLSVNIFVDDTAYVDLVFRNIGSDTLDWEITGSGGGALESWITVSAVMDSTYPGYADTVEVRIVSTGLVDSYYTGIIEVHSNDPVEPVVEVPVILEISELRVVSPLADIRVNEGFVRDTVDIRNVFEHATGDTIIYMVTSLNMDVVTVSMGGDSLLFIDEVGAGNSVITIRASDTSGNVAYDDFVYVINASPMVVEPIADLVLPIGFGTKVIDLRTVFNDPNGDPLTYSALSNDVGIVTVSTSTFNLVINEAGTGSTYIVAVADDGMGTPARDTVNIYVNTAPVVSDPIADVVTNNGFGTMDIDLSLHFSDPDSNPLTYSVVNSNDAAVTAAVSGNTLTITEVGLGVSTITVTADDGLMGNVSDAFDFTVNGAPTVDGPLADLDLPIGFGTDKVDASAVFSDPDSDVLALSVTSLNTAVVTVSMDGDSILITEVGSGSAQVVLSADDGNGGIAADTFAVVVNTTPTVANPIADVSVDEGFGTRDIDLSGVFADADSDVLSYTAASSNTAVVTVVVSGNTLTVTEVGIGTSTITVTANDGNGSTVDDGFAFVVNDVIGVELTSVDKMLIYPNPTEDKIWLKPAIIGLENIKIVIVNTIGQKVFENDYGVMGAKELIDLEGYSNGLYYMKIFVNDELKRVEKIVLE